MTRTRTRLGIFTAKQLEDYKAFEKVRAAGRWNMFEKTAQRATGLNDDEHAFVVKNYLKLRAEVSKS